MQIGDWEISIRSERCAHSVRRRGPQVFLRLGIAAPGGQPYPAEFGAAQGDGSVAHSLRDRLTGGDRDRHGLRAGTRAHPGLQAVQSDAMLGQAGHDVDQGAAGGLRLETLTEVSFQAVP